MTEVYGIWHQCRNLWPAHLLFQGDINIFKQIPNIVICHLQADITVDQVYYGGNDEKLWVRHADINIFHKLYPSVIDITDITILNHWEVASRSQFTHL